MPEHDTDGMIREMYARIMAGHPPCDTVLMLARERDQKIERWNKLRDRIVGTVATVVVLAVLGWLVVGMRSSIANGDTAQVQEAGK